jgi:hypothetical protein
MEKQKRGGKKESERKAQNSRQIHTQILHVQQAAVSQVELALHHQYLLGGQHPKSLLATMSKV